MPQAEKVERAPPYISYSSFRTMIGGLKEHGVPAQIDRSVLGNFAGSVATQLLTALRFLGLVEQDGKTLEKLNGLVEAFQTPQWGSALSGVVRDAYKPIMAHDLKTATPNMIDKAFRESYGGADAVQKKCVTFFLHAARDASMGLSSHLSKSTRRPGKRGPRTPKEKSDSKGAGTPPPVKGNGEGGSPGRPPSFDAMLLQMLDPVQMNEEERNAVWTLILYLKKRPGGAE